MTVVVLASSSETRKALLEAAGINAVQTAPRVDETAIKTALQAAAAAAPAAALALAEAKALDVGRRQGQALVIGADQMLDCEGRWFDKPSDRESAYRQLQYLRGRTHRLSTAVVVTVGGAVLWHHLAEATLTMRPFNDATLECYLDQAGSAALSSVGAYQLERLGAQLFSKVAGDHFAILGLPLLPLLEFLRSHGVGLP